MALGPAQVHPQQHLGEVCGIHAAGLRADRHDGLALVIGARQQGADLQGIDLGAQRGQFLIGLGGGVLVAVLGGELQQDLDVVDPGPQVLEPVDLGLQGRQPRCGLLGVLLVVPQVGCGDLLLELGDLCTLGVWVEHRLDGFQGVIEVVGCLLKVYKCHDAPFYRASGCGAGVRIGCLRPEMDPGT